MKITGFLPLGLFDHRSSPHSRLEHTLLELSGSAAPDRFGGRLSEGTPADLRADLVRLFGPEQVLSRPADLVRYASDASPYRMIPAVVLVARDEDDVIALLRYAHEHGRTVTFRSAGTSLNGQSQGSDILVDVRRNFTGAGVEQGGAILRGRPGMIIARANAMLYRYGRKLGPDPASSAAATLGGSVANNASGMTCGVQNNSYNTVRSMRIVLASGTVVDTADPDADRLLAAAEPELVAALMDIKRDLATDAELTARVRHKFEIKETNGYRLDAFLDGDSPAQILRGLLVGSEGTLGFVSEIVFDTVPEGHHRSTALLRFPDLYSATEMVPALVHARAVAVELMDATALRAAKAIPNAPSWLGELGDDEAALLVEFRVADPAELDAAEQAARTVLATAKKSVTGEFTRDRELIETYWKVREGLEALLGANRPAGTLMIGEDVCVAPERIADAALDLRRVLDRFRFPAAIAGHASAGNVHFTMTFDPADPADVQRYIDCMDAVVELILQKYDGSLKAEHGTGRNMAPYLIAEWGSAAVTLMQRAKQALDPYGILNPGVILNDDPQAMTRYLKTIPSVGDSVLDRCIECGFCEPVCPSRNLTTTPRQRIVLQREIARQAENSAVAAELAEAYDYDAVQTCAADGSCVIACPVGIDTGMAMKRLRHAEHSPRGERVAGWIAARWALVERVARWMVALGSMAARVVGNAPLRLVTRIGRRIFGADLVPEWLPEMPHPAPAKLPKTERAGATAVYFPACINRIFGTPHGTKGRPTVVEAVVRLGERAGKPVWIPSDVIGTCCATVWQSKGYQSGNALMANRLVDNLWRWTDGGTLPVVIDASSCSYGAIDEVVPYLTDENKRRHAALELQDSLTWAQNLLPHLTVGTKLGTAIVHPTCSMRHLGDDGELTELARAIADTVIEPVVATCCGFAGDRGFLHRELTERATGEETEEVCATHADAYFSANRTCEMGMHHNTGHPYESVLIELERLTR